MTLRPPGRRRTARALLLAAPLTLTLLAAGCSDDAAEADADPTAVLASAKETLDATPGLHVTLSTDDLPEGVDGLVSADGIATHAPAFDGTITVSYSGLEPEVPVIAVDGTVYAQVPLTTGWSEIDPADYGAPDPAALITPDEGFSALLSAADGVTKGETVRGGADFKDVLTSYDATLPASVVAGILPTAEGDFEASFQVTDAGELRQVELTGDFYGTGDSETYTIGLDDYGTEKDITAP